MKWARHWNNTAWSHLYTESKNNKFTETESKRVDIPGTRWWETGRSWSKGTNLQVWDDILCRFWFEFLWCLVMLGTFLYICLPLFVFFGNMSIQFFHPLFFFYWVDFSVNPLLDIWLWANIFSHSKGFFFFLFGCFLCSAETC